MRKRALLLGQMFDVDVVQATLEPELEVIRGNDLEPACIDEILPTIHALCGGRVTDKMMAKAPNLEVIGVPASGFDGIDIPTANELGISVVLAAGTQYNAVAEHAIGLMLSLSKRIAWSDRLMHNTGKYPPRSLYTGDGFPQEIDRKTVLILGFGFIGRDLANKCRLGFNMRVLAYDPYGDPMEAGRQHVQLARRLDELRVMLSQADFVVLTLPLTPETRGIVGRDELASMKSSAFLINCSRGGTADEAALIEALRVGAIAGAGIDVFDPEPTADDHPFFTMENVVVTPHIGGWVREALPRLAAAVSAEMLSALRGERPLRMANPEVWNGKHRRARG
jgi:D-3-phosphoglycerate dehydrogenase